MSANLYNSKKETFSFLDNHTAEYTTGDNRVPKGEAKKVGRVIFLSGESPEVVKEQVVVKEKEKVDESSLYLALSEAQNKEILNLSEHLFKIRNNVSVPGTL